MHCLPAFKTSFMQKMHNYIFISFFKFSYWLYIVLGDSLMKHPIPVAYIDLFFYDFKTTKIENWSENLRKSFNHKMDTIFSICVQQ